MDETIENKGDLISGIETKTSDALKTEETNKAIHTVLDQIIPQLIAAREEAKSLGIGSDEDDVTTVTPCIHEVDGIAYPVLLTVSLGPASVLKPEGTVEQ